ncbi:hypothetical protein PC129_g18917 [Phytophthora cactorum]|uniref:Uncharacterized protein n=1 Tax=Phytophthora cactorum TaxID=29920 RepID=A0A329S8P0_9STRA|nr:hypothetical protein Pcac1_g18578 [Phytophthora cactorum]KAG2832540.1 hypothetical protein PC113_g20731 [Phytophthora cactorum]KAG2878595.1 hypothetical protein PC114_g23028 [Phytophthora cactorum]KAG2886915.1 hypothetical protein PC115_g20533 [Phytophthora cactorum]KAG3045615.1 hypothetical protein PC121_g21160 [Phytophthora cactorum]
MSRDGTEQRLDQFGTIGRLTEVEEVAIREVKHVEERVYVKSSACLIRQPGAKERSIVERALDEVTAEFGGEYCQKEDAK